MQLTQFKVPSNFNLFLCGDNHEGTIAQHKAGWEQLCHMVNTSVDGLKVSANFVIHHGDIIEGIMVDDKRYDLSLHKDTPLQQAQQAIKILEPIKRNLKLLLEGNHTMGKLTKFGLLVEDVICPAVRVQYGTFSSKVHWMDSKERLLFKSFHTHGGKTINSTADDPKRRRVNMELILKRHLKNKAGDCVLLCKGHSHKLLISKPELDLYLTDNGERITQAYTTTSHTDDFINMDMRWYVNTGSFLKMYVEGQSTYNERAEYDPVELGFVLAKIRDRKIASVEKIILGGDN